MRLSFNNATVNIAVNTLIDDRIVVLNNRDADDTVNRVVENVSDEINFV